MDRFLNGWVAAAFKKIVLFVGRGHLKHFFKFPFKMVTICLNEMLIDLQITIKPVLSDFKLFFFK